MIASDKTEVESPVVVPIRTGLTAEVFKKKVLVTLPWQKNTNPMTAHSVFSLLDKRRTATLLNFGDAFVAHSRNTCADLFLQTDLEWMLTIDDDMLIPFGNAEWFNSHTGFNLPDEFAGQNALDRLLSHGKTLVGGLYFGKHNHGPPMYCEGMFNKEEAAYSRRAPLNEVRPTRWVGTGCLLIHRSVFEAIEKTYPLLGRKANGRGGNWFSASEHRVMDHIDRTMQMLSDGPMTGEKAVKAYEMLEAARADAARNASLGMGEDVSFCVRAKEAGHQPYVDFGLVCGHIGYRVYGPGNTKPKLT